MSYVADDDVHFSHQDNSGACSSGQTYVPNERVLLLIMIGLCADLMSVRWGHASDPLYSLAAGRPPQPCDICHHPLQGGNGLAEGETPHDGAGAAGEQPTGSSAAPMAGPGTEGNERRGGRDGRGRGTTFT